jgi:hypothetical protein
MRIRGPRLRREQRREVTVRTRFKGGLGAALAVTAALLASGCAGSAEEADSESQVAVVEPVDGTNVNRVTLVAHAAERLGIEPALIEHGPVIGSGASAASRVQTSVPASAVIYDAKGRAWVYTSPEPLVFVRERIGIAEEFGHVAVLSSGPPPGTTVVTVGVQELWGTEYEVGED